MFIIKRYNQCVLCIVGSHIAYRGVRANNKIIQVFIKVKILFSWDVVRRSESNVKVFIIS